MKTFYLFCIALCILPCGSNILSQEKPVPTPGQQAMIDRKYGLFLHVGINTYLDKEWSDGSDTAAVFAPPNDMAWKADQWVKNAWEAGMRSVVLTTKHHDGFCLWDSRYTTHDIANPGITNQIDIVKAVSDACRRYGLAFAVYYSLWDRHEPCYSDPDKNKYMEYMKGQLDELMTRYGPVSELWLDGAWDRPASDWNLPELYRFVKQLQPDCQISTNWTLGKRPADMHEGDSILYFPADFRLWDPYLPLPDDPKIYTYAEKNYYLPFECTQTISVLGNWFYHPSDTTVREPEELEELFYVATANDNCLLLNVPPDRDGNQNPVAVKRIKELAQALSIGNGKAFPAKWPEPRSLTSRARAQASSVLDSDSLHWRAGFAIDSDVSTAWKCADSTGWLCILPEKEITFSQIRIIEEKNRIRQFSVDIEKDGKWLPVFHGVSLSDEKNPSFMGYGFGEIRLDAPVTTQKIRLRIEKATGLPGIYSIRLK